LHKSKEKDLEEILGDFKKNLHSFKNTATSWVFPKEKRKLSGGDGYLYPGVVLTIKPLRLRK
jgi:hypothetical protein